MQYHALNYHDDAYPRVLIYSIGLAILSLGLIATVSSHL